MKVEHRRCHRPLATIVGGFLLLATPALWAVSFLGSDWLADQPDDHYTLQLVSTPLVDRLDDFVRRYKLQGELVHLVVVRDHGDEHVLILGSYPDRAAADDAAATLSVKPWVRTIGSLRSILKPMSAAEPMLPAGSLEPAGLRDAAWLWSQDPSHFTIQVASGLDRGALEGLAKQLPPNLAAALYSETRDGAPWYSLVCGDFADKTSASAGLDSLSEAIRARSPWLKTFAHIHDEMSLGLR